MDAMELPISIVGLRSASASKRAVITFFGNYRRCFSKYFEIRYRAINEASFRQSSIAARSEQLLRSLADGLRHTR